MKKYKFPLTTIDKIICSKCKTVLKNEKPKPMPILPHGEIMPISIQLPIDYYIEGNKIGFHCNACNNEDDFEIITLETILRGFWLVY